MRTRTKLIIAGGAVVAAAFAGATAAQAASITCGDD
jgi:hypothetical protein